MKVVKVFEGDLGGEEIRVACNLANASAPVLADYRAGNGWESTQYQCADARHTVRGLEDIAIALATRAVEISVRDFSCSVMEIDLAQAEMPI